MRAISVSYIDYPGIELQYIFHFTDYYSWKSSDSEIKKGKWIKIIPLWMEQLKQ